MKRIILFVTVAFAALVFAAVPAFAAEEPGSTGVNITIVMPDGTEKQQSAQTAPVVTQPSVPAAQTLYPVSVEEIREDGIRYIVKTYALSAFENPANISRESFERLGWRYELTDVTRTETAIADAREHTETVTLNTESKDIQAILGQLAPTLEFTTEDGYAGVLTLDIPSVKTEQAGTKNTSFNVSATREYPHLSSNDTSLLPKTIVDGGRTLTLAGVDWRAGNLVTVDYVQMPEYYTAVATYTGTGSKTVVTGYVTTAEYTGTVAKTSPGNTVYTACFLGTEIVPERTPLEVVETTPTPEPGAEYDPTVATEATDTPDITETPGTTDAADKTEAAHANPAILITLAVILSLLVGATAGRFISHKKNPIIRKDDVNS
jgi:hypothetical protein